MNNLLFEINDYIVYLICLSGMVINVIEFLKLLRSKKENSENSLKKPNKIMKKILFFLIFCFVGVVSFIESFIYTYAPNVLGLTYPEACAILSEHNLKFNKLEFDNINNYRVSSQNIKEEYVKKNTVIYLEIEEIRWSDVPSLDLPTIDAVTINLFENVADIKIPNNNYSESFQKEIDVKKLKLNSEDIYLLNKDYNYRYDFFEYSSDYYSKTNGITFHNIPVGEYEIIISLDNYEAQAIPITLSKKYANLQQDEKTYSYLNVNLNNLNQRPYLPYNFVVVDENFEYIKNKSFYLNTMEHYLNFSVASDEYGVLNVHIDASPGTQFWIQSVDTLSDISTYSGSFELNEADGLMVLLLKEDGNICAIKSDSSIFNLEYEESGKIIYNGSIINYGNNAYNDLEVYEIELRIHHEINNNISFILSSVTGSGFSFQEQNITFQASQGVYQIEVYGKDGKLLFYKNIYVSQNKVFDIYLI